VAGDWPECRWPERHWPECHRLGRGKRIKRTRAVYSPTPIQESSTEEEMESECERTGSSGVPPMPNGLAETFNRSSRKTL
jgi:hypothetical protein